TYLNRALESTLAPIVIFATNRGMCTIRGTDIVSPHGIPIDLLDRLVIIRTQPYELSDSVQIINIRATTEGIQMEADSLALLGDIASKTSLRYAIQLLTPANILARSRGRSQVVKDDVQEVHSLFLDAKKSAMLLARNADKYISQ